MNKHVLRELDLALVEGDRAEILEQFDRAVVMLADTRHWREGLAAARRVYAEVRTWYGFDASAHARTVAQFAHNYALEFQKQRMYQAAEELLREALALFEEYGDANSAMTSRYQLARVLQERCEYAEAEHFYLANIEQARRIEDLRQMGHNLFYLGQLAHLQGDFNRGAEWYRQALSIAESANDEALIIASLLQLGMIAQERKDFDEATRWFQGTLARAEKNGDTLGMANALHQLGMLAQAQRELTRAEELYAASLKHAARLDDSSEAIPTLYQLAQVAMARGNFASAENFCRRSLSLVQAQEDVPAIARVRRLLTSIQSCATQSI